MILIQFILCFYVVVLAEDLQYEAPDNDLDYSWAVPKEGCQPVAEGGSISVDCSISGTQFSYKVDRGATYVTIEYFKPSPLICSNFDQVKPLVVNYTSSNGQTDAHLRIFIVKFGILSNDSLACALALLGTNDTSILRLDRSRGQLMPHHVAGIEGVTKLQMLNIEKNMTSVPYSAMTMLDSLQSATLTGASFILKEEGADNFLPNLKTLEISQGGLKTLPKRAFVNTPNITFLLLYSNQIEYVDVNAFEGLTKLEQLSLAENRIATLPIGVFQSTTNLMVIDIYKNMFTNLTEGVFNELTKLTVVSLMYNKVNLTLYGGVFSNLQSLKHLKLNYASLHTVPAELVTNSPHLETIDMSNNFLVTLPANIFPPVSNSAIVSINLSDNLLNNIAKEQFTNLKSLKTLNLMNNFVANLSVGVFNDLVNLETLSLVNNTIETLQTFVFKGLNNLQKLYLDKNQIKSIEFGVFDVLSKLHVLSLSNNNLTISKTTNTDIRIDSVGYGVLEGYSELHYQYWSRFQPLVDLTELNLSGNLVSVVCDDWQQQMFSLRKLDLSNNNFTRLTVGDTYFPTNVTVDFSNNKIESVDIFAFEASVPRDTRPLFRLMGNPFKCTCDLYDFVSMSKDNTSRIELGDAKCGTPFALRGASVAALKLDQLVCSEQCSPCDCSLIPALSRFEMTCGAVPDPTTLNSLTNLTSLDKYKYKRSLRITNSSIVNGVLENLPPDVELDIDLTNLGLKIPPMAPLNRTALLTMDLRNNSLNTVPTALLSAGVKVYLENNLLECTCEHRDDFQAGFKDAIIDFNKVKCLGERSLAEAFRAGASGELCARRVAILAISSIIALLLLTLAIAAYLYKRKTRIQIICRKYFPRLVSDYTRNRSKYDVFVSYAYPDEGFVQKKVIPELEGKLGLRLCVHSRDWRFGENIPQQGENSVRDSALTLALLSPDYLKSAWCSQELRLAHSRGTLLILVLDNAALDKASGHVQALVNEYVRANAYVRASHPRVWNKVREAVFKRVTLSSAVAISAKEDKPRGLNTQLTKEGKIVNAAISPV